MEQTHLVFSSCVEVGLSARVLVVAAAALVCASAQAITVNVSSLSSAGTSVTLGAGTYEVSSIGTAQGGLYNAWNPWGENVVSGCAVDGTGCGNGWTSRFAITIGATTLQYIKDAGSSNPYYATALQSLASYQAAPLYELNAVPGSAPALVTAPVTFTLGAATAVQFSVLDSNFADNFGGVSLSVNAVPEPQTLALMSAGGLFVAFAARRRRA